MRTSSRYRAVATLDRTQPTAPRSPIKGVVQDYLNPKLPQRSDKTKPPAYNTKMNGGVGDAYRHYISYGILADILKGLDVPFSEQVAVLIGDMGELNISGYDRMDQHNNRAGVDRPRPSVFSRDYWQQRTLDFMNDVAVGKIQVMDFKTGEPRSTDYRDVYREPYERPYRPETEPIKDFLGDNTTIIA